MYKNKKILGLIPARSGSKRIKDKNIKHLNNKPLIYYSIKVGLESNYIDNIVLSSDSSYYLKIAQKYGANVHARPTEISKDGSSDLELFLNILEKDEYKNYDYLVYLRPTQPFRTSEIIDQCIEKIEENNFTCLRTVRKAEGNIHPYWTFRVEENLLKPFINSIYISRYHQRQLLPLAYQINGIVDIFDTKIIKNYEFWGEHGHYGTKTGYEVINNKIMNIDIDNEIDFQFANFILDKGFWTWKNKTKEKKS